MGNDAKKTKPKNRGLSAVPWEVPVIIDERDHPFSPPKAVSAEPVKPEPAPLIFEEEPTRPNIRVESVKPGNAKPASPEPSFQLSASGDVTDPSIAIEDDGESLVLALIEGSDLSLGNQQRLALAMGRILLRKGLLSPGELAEEIDCADEDAP